MNMLTKYNRPMTPREKSIRNQFGFMFIATTLGLLVMTLFWSNKVVEVKYLTIERDSLININDSLNMELFNEKTQNGRYELTLEHLEEVNPKAAKEFNDYLEHETE